MASGTKGREGDGLTRGVVGVEAEVVDYADDTYDKGAKRGEGGSGVRWCGRIAVYRE